MGMPTDISILLGYARDSVRRWRRQFWRRTVQRVRCEAAPCFYSWRARRQARRPVNSSVIPTRPHLRGGQIAPLLLNQAGLGGVAAARQSFIRYGRDARPCACTSPPLFSRMPIGLPKIARPKPCRLSGRLCERRDGRSIFRVPSRRVPFRRRRPCSPLPKPVAQPPSRGRPSLIALAALPKSKATRLYLSHFRLHHFV